MTDKGKAPARQQRLAAKLKENLRRRKAQAKARRESPGAGDHKSREGGRGES